MQYPFPLEGVRHAESQKVAITDDVVVAREAIVEQAPGPPALEIELGAGEEVLPSLDEVLHGCNTDAVDVVEPAQPRLEVDTFEHVVVFEAREDAIAPG